MNQPPDEITPFTLKSQNASHRIHIVADSKTLVTIHPSGEIEFGPDYEPTEAARIFWESDGRTSTLRAGRSRMKLFTAISLLIFFAFAIFFYLTLKLILFSLRLFVVLLAFVVGVRR